MDINEKYTATIHFNDDQGEYSSKSGNNLEELINWVSNQAKDSLSDVEAEIMDNQEKKIVKSIRYVLAA